MIRFRELRPSSFGNGPPTEVPNDEDEILSGSAAARIVTCYASHGSGRNARKQHSAPAYVQVLGPRGRGTAFERCLHDRPRPNPMRRANVSWATANGILQSFSCYWKKSYLTTTRWMIMKLSMLVVRGARKLVWIVSQAFIPITGRSILIEAGKSLSGAGEQLLRIRAPTKVDDGIGVSQRRANSLGAALVDVACLHPARSERYMASGVFISDGLSERVMYPWPIGDFDYKMDEALDIALNYLECTGQAAYFIEVQRAAAMAIVAAWKTGVRHRIKLADVAIKAVEQRSAPQQLLEKRG
jgi:hypothetical protein